MPSLTYPQKINLGCGCAACLFKNFRGSPLACKLARKMFRFHGKCRIRRDR
jgi:hypothetical protein